MRFHAHIWRNHFVHWMKMLTIDIFSLYILFSHFTPRDALMGIFLAFFISYAYICTCIRRPLKETIPSSSITWSEMGQQNIQAKEVYYSFSMPKRKVTNKTKPWLVKILKPTIIPSNQFSEVQFSCTSTNLSLTNDLCLSKQKSRLRLMTFLIHLLQWAATLRELQEVTSF